MVTSLYKPVKIWLPQNMVISTRPQDAGISRFTESLSIDWKASFCAIILPKSGNNKPASNTPDILLLTSSKRKAAAYLPATASPASFCSRITSERIYMPMRKTSRA
ncbi:hypothetical protein D3C80_1229060 [compost metagenome]